MMADYNVYQLSFVTVEIITDYSNNANPIIVAAVPFVIDSSSVNEGLP